MKAKFKKRECYSAPRMEATGFRTENGYAMSGRTEKLLDVEISFGS